MATNPTPSPSLLASISALNGAPGALLIRHSDRFHIPQGQSGAAVRLTDTGRARAQALGRQLSGPPTWALSSPLDRCVDTATLIGATPVHSAVLGAPGPFVLDPDLGRDLFHGHDIGYVVRGQISGETWGCMRPLAEGARLVHALLAEQVALQPGLGVAVSHDAIVMPYIAWATGHTFADDWLDPLDGLVVTKSAVFWRGKRFEVPR